MTAAMCDDVMSGSPWIIMFKYCIYGMAWIKKKIRLYSHLVIWGHVWNQTGIIVILPAISNCTATVTKMHHACFFFFE